MPAYLKRAPGGQPDGGRFTPSDLSAPLAMATDLMDGHDIR